MTLNSQCLLKI